MDRHSIGLRAANPTFDEGLAFARYADEVAEGFFRLMLGRRAEQILARAFAQPDHDLSYQRVTFAERENVIVGMVLGYTAEQHRRSSRQPLERAAGRLRLRTRIVQLLFASVMRIVDSIADGDFYVQFIAVDEDLRGDGVGSVLMDSAEERARASGSTRLSLDVSAKNEAISEFPKWRKYLILLSFLDNSSARPVQIGGVDVNICHSRVDRSPRTPAVQFAIPSAGAILSHTDGPCGS